MSDHDVDVLVTADDVPRAVAALESVRARIDQSPFARAFFTMTEGLGVVAPAPPGGGRSAV